MFSSFFEGAVEVLARFLMWIFYWIVNGIGFDESILTQNPIERFQGAYTVAMTISDVLKESIGWSLITLFLLIELAEVLKKQEARGIDSIYFVGNVILKVGMAKLLMDNLGVIVQMIFDTSQYALQSVTQNASTQLSYDGFTNTANLEFFEQAIENTFSGPLWEQILSGMTMGNGIYQFVLFIMVILSFLISVGVDLFIQIIFYTRVIELFVFMTIGSLAISTAPSREYSPIFKNWVKRFVGIGLQALLILTILAMYNVFISDVAATFAKDTTIMGLFGMVVVIKVCVAFAISKSGSWAKSLVDAH